MHDNINIDSVYVNYYLLSHKVNTYLNCCQLDMAFCSLCYYLAVVYVAANTTRLCCVSIVTRTALHKDDMELYFILCEMNICMK